MMLFELLFSLAETFMPSCYTNFQPEKQRSDLLFYEGFVKDVTNKPVCLAEVKVDNRMFYTNKDGKFLITNLESGQHSLVITVGEDNMMVFNFSANGIQKPEDIQIFEVGS